ncbi:hypothetical protein COE56_07200 [Bacillus anthracis]|nr:hypothetical protein [Bacillus cereus]PGZ54416.1 hypothetical protein COE56_07200 [Bacillus anthracis]
MIIHILLFSLWLLLILILTIKLKDLRTAINMLPKLDFSAPYDDPLLGENVNNILSLPTTYKKHDESIVIIMSATCKACHDKLDEIIQQQKHLSHHLILYIKSDNSALFEELSNNIYQKSNLIIFPLSKKQQLKLNVILFPTFIHINSQGIVKKISTLADKAI